VFEDVDISSEIIKHATTAPTTAPAAAPATTTPPFVPTSHRNEIPNTRWVDLGVPMIPRSGLYKKKKKTPLLSCGIICFYEDGSRREKNAKVLLVRRKDSMSYVEFVRGKYKPSDPLYIRSLIRGMTKKEHDTILKHSFYDIWSTMWATRNIRHHRQEYEKSKRRFEECIQTVREYIGTLTHTNTEPEWTFPKGRPHKGERDIDCALREFEEETGIPKSRLQILSPMPLKEVYTGSNGIIYETHLYIATTDESSPIVDPSNLSQISEVSGVEWIPQENILEKMRSSYLSKEVILREAINHFLIRT